VQAMKFEDRFIIKNNSISMFRGMYRDKSYFETCIECDAKTIKDVYSLMKMVYNIGEYEGKLAVRSDIKTALGLDHLDL
jgi:hypothetical protein